MPVTRPSDFTLTVSEDPASAGGLRVTFVPPGSQRAGDNGPPPQYVLSVGKPPEFRLWWIAAPDDAAVRQEFEELAGSRARERDEWLRRLADLVGQVKRWADELDWATRVIDKPLEDPEIGNYRAPALLLQQETVRLFLEPVARKAPGADGVVDLYLMPYYDDIATLFYYDEQWHVHYAFVSRAAVTDVRDDDARPLTKETVSQVFGEMRAHAG